MKWNRRKFLLSMAAATTGVLGYGLFEKQWLEVVRRPVKLSKPLGGIRLLHLSDLHARNSYGLELIADAIDLGLAEKPDVICLTGDFVSHQYSDEAGYVRLLSRLSAAAPALTCLGNHDGGRWAKQHSGYRDRERVLEMIKASGIQTLENASQTVRVKGADLCITGMGDLWAGFFDPATAFKNAVPATASIALSHNPDTKNELLQYPWELLLCGHTHGGQLSIPLIGEPFAPVRDKRFIAGLYEWEERQIYITRGVGCSGVPMRFNCRPEVTVLTLL